VNHWFAYARRAAQQIICDSGAMLGRKRANCWREAQFGIHCSAPPNRGADGRAGSTRAKPGCGGDAQSGLLRRRLGENRSWDFSSAANANDLPEKDRIAMWRELRQLLIFGYVSFNDRVGHDDRPGVDRCLSVHGPREDFRSSPSSIEMSLPSKICVAVISMLLECKPLRVA
jgi:hypothetical protein